MLIGYFTIQPELFGDFLKDAIRINSELHPAMEELAHEFHGATEMALHGFTTLPFFLALGGVVTAFVFYLVAPQIPAMFAKVLRPLIFIGENKYFLDWFNENVLAAGARLLGRGLWKVGDQVLIDGVMVNGSAGAVGWFAGLTGMIQSGRIYRYALAMLFGVVAFLSLWRA